MNFLFSFVLKFYLSIILLSRPITSFKKTGESWSHSTSIIFSVENSPSSLSNRETCNEIRSALRVWEKARISHKFTVTRLRSGGWYEICKYKLQIRELSKAKTTGEDGFDEDPTIVISFTYVDGPGKTLAHYYPAKHKVYGKQIHFDRSERWVTKNAYV